jgi:signal transduction histidine kinase
LLANEKGQRLQLKVEQPLAVFGNPAQLGLVIRNLLTNAIKYTPNGGQINCECRLINTDSIPNEADWPNAARLSPGRWAALRVVDNGVGIAPEHIPHLFDRFYRVQTQQTIRGTGLGLSIAQDLINFHNGSIAVSSVPGNGSIFAIYLPLIEEISGGRE